MHSDPSLLQEDLYLIRGREPILKVAQALEDLTRRTGQLGAMHWLPYFLATRPYLDKPPFLVLQLSRKPGSEGIHSEDIRAAALFFEYRPLGIPTGIFSTDDAVGYRTVVAHRHERDRFSRRAALALLNSRAHIVLTNYAVENEGSSQSALQANVLEGWRERRVPRMLHLAHTLDETLAQFGHSTRFNLRYYRRRLAKQVQLEYIEDAGAHMTFEAFASFNASSLNPVTSAREVQLRWDNSTAPDGSFVVGLRSAEGNWLSLIGGWRHETTTILYWQTNASGYEQHSIGTVMRSFFFEHEIARGARELLIYGGTPHTICHAFREDTIADLLLCRDSLRSRLCRTVSRRLSFLRSNHLLRTLSELELHPCQHSVAGTSPVPEATLKLT